MPIPATATERGACKICGGLAPLFGVVDFNKSCEEQRGARLPLAGVPVYYRRCGSCGFVFTDMLDAWSDADFAARIYNADYVKVDPDYVDARPRGNAQTIARLFGNHAKEIVCLDYGGGSGLLARLLREAGFARAETYDRFNPDFAARPEGRFDLVTCFEVFEHTIDPVGLVADLVRLVEQKGLVMFSTLLAPANLDQAGVSWWYIAPRNGHVSIFSRPALSLLLGKAGLKLGSFNDGLHLAFRTLPGFAAHLVKG